MYEYYTNVKLLNINIMTIDISKLNIIELKKLLHDCEETLGLVSVKEYSEIINKSKRHIFDLIHANKIEYIERNNQYYIIINDHL